MRAVLHNSGIRQVRHKACIAHISLHHIPGGYCNAVNSIVAIATEHDKARDNHAWRPSKTLKINPAMPPSRVPPELQSMQSLSICNCIDASKAAAKKVKVLTWHHSGASRNPVSLRNEVEEAHMMMFLPMQFIGWEEGSVGKPNTNAHDGPKVDSSNGSDHCVLIHWCIPPISIKARNVPQKASSVCTKAKGMVSAINTRHSVNCLAACKSSPEGQKIKHLPGRLAEEVDAVLHHPSIARNMSALPRSRTCKLT